MVNNDARLYFVIYLGKWMPDPRIRYRRTDKNSNRPSSEHRHSDCWSTAFEAVDQPHHQTWRSYETVPGIWHMKRPKWVRLKQVILIKGLSINDVTQFWTIFDPVVTLSETHLGTLSTTPFIHRTHYSSAINEKQPYYTVFVKKCVLHFFGVWPSYKNMDMIILFACIRLLCNLTEIR